jgi:PAS domain S-box-containing protein
MMGKMNDRDQKQSSDNRWPHDQGSPALADLNRPSFWLVINVLIIAVVFYLLDVKESWDSASLTLVLNIVFVVLPTIFIAIISTWSFIRVGSWQVFWMGAGTSAYGLAVFMAMWTRTWASMNAMRTIFTINYLLAGCLFLIGAAHAIRKNASAAQGSEARRRLIVLSAYFALIVFCAAITYFSVREMLPEFYIPDAGSTGLQLIIQGIAIALFLMAGLMILAVYLQVGTTFLRWYSLGLILTVINSGGNLLLKSYGTPFSWILRAAQLLAGVYLTMAALIVIREARARHLHASETMADLFTNLQNKMIQTEKSYRSLFENIDEALALCEMILDDNGLPVDYRLHMVNPAFERNIGLKKEDIIGKNIKSLLPNVSPQAIEMLGRVAATGETIQFEQYSQKLEKWFKISAYRSEEGLVAYLASDITEQKEAEQKISQEKEQARELLGQLERSNRQITHIINSIEDDFYVLDWNWNFVFASRTFTSRIGKAPEDFVGKNIWQMFPRHIGTAFEENVRAVMEKREIRRFQISGKYTDAVYRVSAFPSEEGITVLGTDITEAKRTEKALIESEERFRTLSETSLVGVSVSSPEGLLLYANRSYERILGYDQGELFGKQVQTLYCDPTDRLAWLDILENGGVVQDTELKLKRKDGTLAWVLISASFIIFSGAKAIMSTIQDISGRKKAEDALQHYAADLEASNRELEAFAYSLSHDLRAPLRTLDGFSQVVLDDYGDKLDEAGRDYLGRIRNAAQYMAHITEDMLKLSRVIRADLRLEPFDVSGAVSATLQELGEKEPGRKVEIVVAPGVMVNGDKALLQIALRNILDNAWKFTKKNPQARIEFGTGRLYNTDIYFVKDNGVGFDMKYADKLFQPFQRLNVDRDFPGTGIGLATVQRIIKRHSGDIWAESEPGRGTSVFFTLGEAGQAR